MKKIMVYAYTAFNLGDDLFIKVLCERYPKTKFLIYAPKEYKVLFDKIDNLTVIPSNSILIRGINFAFRVFNIKSFVRRLIAKTCDAGVYIGGSLFIQGEKWLTEFENVKNMQIKNKPFFLLGANFGPYKDTEFLFKYKEIFRGYTDICFREKYSYEMFSDLNNTRRADDIVFQLKDTSEQQYNDKNIVISVIKPSIRKNLINYDDIYYKKIRDIAVYFVEKGYSVSLISFCEYEEDDEAIEGILKLIPKKHSNQINSHFYKLDIEKTLSVIAASNFVIATRFHSMIVGWVYNKPVFPIVYSDKMTNVMKDVGFKGSFTEFKQIHELQPEHVFNSMETNFHDVSEQVKNAEKHFEKLDKYLVN